MTSTSITESPLSPTNNIKFEEAERKDLLSKYCLWEPLSPLNGYATKDKDGDVSNFIDWVDDPHVRTQGEIASPEMTSELLSHFDEKVDSNFKKEELVEGYNWKVSQRVDKQGRLVRLYRCAHPMCKRKFYEFSLMAKHLEVHDKPRPYPCKFWPKAYTQKGNMLKHMKSHTQPDLDRRRVYTCEFCQNGYTEKYNLKVSAEALRCFCKVSCVFGH